MLRDFSVSRQRNVLNLLLDCKEVLSVLFFVRACQTLRKVVEIYDWRGKIYCFLLEMLYTYSSVESSVLLLRVWKVILWSNLGFRWDEPSSGKKEKTKEDVGVKNPGEWAIYIERLWSSLRVTSGVLVLRVWRWSKCCSTWSMESKGVVLILDVVWIFKFMCRFRFSVVCYENWQATLSRLISILNIKVV